MTVQWRSASRHSSDLASASQRLCASAKGRAAMCDSDVNRLRKSRRKITKNFLNTRRFLWPIDRDLFLQSFVICICIAIIKSPGDCNTNYSQYCPLFGEWLTPILRYFKNPIPRCPPLQDCRRTVSQSCLRAFHVAFVVTEMKCWLFAD